MSRISQKRKWDKLDIADACLNAVTLDEFLEVSLSHLLCVDNVKKAEILIFNKGRKLISVASASNEGSNRKEDRKIAAQSWLLNSTVTHTSRKIKITGIPPVLSIPLPDFSGPLGYLKIQLKKLRIIHRDELNSFYLSGVQIAGKIKEIMMKDEIDDLQRELQHVTLNNREIHHRVTSLSKELYAICAISTKINQWMDFDKSLHKAVSTIRKLFMASSIVVYINNSKTSKPELSAANSRDDVVEAAFLKKIEKAYLKKAFSAGKVFTKVLQPPIHEINPINVDGEVVSMVIGVPLSSKEKTVGMMFLLHESAEPFKQAGLRLLSGMANIMVMGIDNMNLLRQSEQKKEEAQFLVRSIVRFNETLDLKKTLKAVAQKGAEFFDSQCRVYWFSTTKVRMIEAGEIKCRRKAFIRSKTFKEIVPTAMRHIFKLVKSRNGTILIKHVNRSRIISRDIKIELRKSDILSIIAVPLCVIRKVSGFLVLFHGKEERPFYKNDLSFAEALGGSASLAIENARTHTASLEMSEFLEKKISEKTSQIRQIEERQKIRVDNRKDVIFRVNKRNRFVFINKAMEVLTGYSRDALYRGDIKAEEVLVPEDRKRVRDCFEKVLTGALPMVKDFECRHLSQEGDDHQISLTIYPEKDHLGQIVGVEGVGEDITEKKRLESELEKTKDLALLGEFSSAVAHQIRNPLSNILMGTKLLQKALITDRWRRENIDEGCSPPDEDNEILANIFGDLTEGIYNLNHVVTALLEYTKTLKLSRSSQKIEIILRETLNQLRELINQRTVEVEERFDAWLPPVLVDAVLIGHVFENIIRNAIQAMPGGGRLTLFSGYYHQRPGHVFISISDTGPGIEPSEAEKIFRPFYTTKDQGIGLGLSLAHRVIEAHKGLIWVCRNPCRHVATAPIDQNPGDRDLSHRGANFHILLPVDDHDKHNFPSRDK